MLSGETDVMETGIILGSGGMLEGRLWFELGWHGCFKMSERCPQLITKFTICLRSSNLHEHIRAVERPPHLLLFHHPLADSARVVATRSPVRWRFP